MAGLAVNVDSFTLRLALSHRWPSLGPLMNIIYHFAEGLVIVASTPEVFLGNITVVIIVIKVVGHIPIVPGDVIFVDIAVTVVASSNVTDAVGETSKTVIVVAMAIPAHTSATINMAGASTIHAFVFVEDSGDRVWEGGFCRSGAVSIGRFDGSETGAEAEVLPSTRILTTGRAMAVTMVTEMERGKSFIVGAVGELDHKAAWKVECYP